MNTFLTIAAVYLALWLVIRYWVLPNYGTHTLACVFGKHDWCDRHLRCGCKHHDEIIHEEMAR